MKTLVLIWLILLSVTAFADEVRIEINPQKPVVGEVFRAYFRIFTDADEEPVINFVPSSVEVVGKSNQGVSTRTVYANGNLTVTREMTYVYELVGSKAGTGSLRDINVQVGSKTLRHQSVSFNVLAVAEEKSDIFILADVPKKDVFVGEGVVVRYYVYGKYNSPVKNIEIKKFPKLNGFLKRYLQEPENPERVSVEGEHYVRRLVYSAKLFPEKPGDLKIDPLQASVAFAQVSGNDPFGAFGFSRDFRTRNFSSENITLNVRPLPEPVPAHFTGLVGKHEFQLDFGQSKLIVNEPLEIKLTVSGIGMLEGYEAPPLIKNSGFEEFETNGDLKIADANFATKTFDYTYLAKENLKVPASTFSLSYFDPASMKYIATQMTIPELVVAGGQANPKKEKDEKGTKDKKENKTLNGPKSLADFSGPILNDPLKYRSFLPYVNFIVALASLIVALTWFMKHDKSTKSGRGPQVPGLFKRGEFSFGEFARWLSPLIQKTGKAPVAIIRDSELEDGAKAYFIDLLNANDYKDYSGKQANMKFDYRAAYFKSLSKYIASALNESSSKPS